MAYRTPPSLYRLVDKRRRTHGELIDLEKSTESAQNRILVLRAQLEAIDTTIKLHEISIDPKSITPTRTYRPRKGFKYGEMTKLIYQILGTTNSVDLSTNQITDQIIFIKGFHVPDRKHFQEIYLRVRYRLKGLYRERKLEKRSLEGRVYWRIPRS